MIEQVLRPCPFCGHEAKMEFREMDDPNDPNDASVTCSNFECEFGGWWVRPSVWNKRPVEDALGERVEKLESMVERMAKENKEQNATIDVLIKKHSSVQFVNKKLQEKIKRQAERITQLEALYREEIKTKKQEALRERAEKAAAMVERMIVSGDRLYELAEELDDLVDEFRAYPDLFSWRALVAEWKERE